MVSKDNRVRDLIWENEEKGALIFDFDKTLCPAYMQRPIFEAFEIVEREFWAKTGDRAIEVASQNNSVPNFELSYLHSMRELKLSNQDLRKFGGQIPLFPGLDGFFKSLKLLPNIEIYIISSGLREMILGTELAEFCTDIFGCEFSESNGRIDQITNVVTAHSKAHIIDWISRGSNVLGFEYFPPFGVEDLRIPIHNMVYIGDGANDIPAFNFVKAGGGDTWGVYNPAEPAQLAQLENIRKDGRLSGLGVADYRHLTATTGNWLLERAMAINDEIENRKKKRVQDLREATAKKVPTFVHSWTKR